MFEKRNTQDPLLRMFLDRYHLHLLAVPRSGVRIGDVYVYDGNTVTAPGFISDFLEPPYTLPPITEGERLADIEGVISDKKSMSIGIRFLGSFLSAFGIGSILKNVQAKYESKSARFLKFHFTNISRDSARPVLIAENLIGHKIKEDNPLYAEDHRYYVVSSVVKTRSISVAAEDKNEKTLDVDVEITPLIQLSPGVSVERNRSGELTINGTQELVFGVELHELNYHPDKKTFRVDAVSEFIGVLGPDSEARKPVFIGDPEFGDVFLYPYGTNPPI